jgi:alpha-N-arabinofuranosidase
MTQLSSIQVDAGKILSARINPYIFGHFVEDIRDHMDAMLAFVVKDMDFEDEAINGVSAGWFPINNGRNTSFDLEPAAPKHSGHSQKIRIYSADQCEAGIGQNIAVHGGMSYTLRIVARASLEVKELQCEIVDKRTGQRLSAETIHLTSHNWKEYNCTLTPTEQSDHAELRLLISSEGALWPDSTASGILWIDHVSMLPDDAIGIVKREIVEKTRELKPGMMRLAGNYISAYHFEHAIGPDLERPNMINEAWGGWTNKYFGTDEFLKFCEDTDTEPLICVNAGSGTPEEAVQWMEYCNGGVDTPFGALRAKHGRVEPYGVKYWEIGNEIYGPWQVGHCSAEEFAHRYVRFAKAMKEVDPTVVLLACGDVVPEWNRTLLEIAGEHIDQLTLHIYHGFGTVGIDPATPSQERYTAMVTFAETTRHIIAQTSELIRKDERTSHIKLAITEYATMYYPNTIRKGLPMEHTLESAVANATNLNEFIRQSDLIQIGSYSDLVNGWLAGLIRVGDYYADQYRGKQSGWSGKSTVVYGTPTFYLMKLYANLDIAYVINSQVECSTFSFTNKKFPQLASEIPVLDVVSCLNDTLDKLTVFVVNRGLESAEAKIQLDAFAAAQHVKLSVIEGDDYEQINSVFEPEAIICKERSVSIQENEPMIAQLPPHSIHVYEFTKLNTSL